MVSVTAILLLLFGREIFLGGTSISSTVGCPLYHILRSLWWVMVCSSIPSFSSSLIGPQAPYTPVTVGGSGALIKSLLWLDFMQLESCKCQCVRKSMFICACVKSALANLNSTLVVLMVILFIRDESVHGSVTC